MEPDLLFTLQTRQGDGRRPRNEYNRYGDDFVVDRIDLKKIVEEMVGLESITVSQDIDIVDDHDQEWIEDRSKPEVDFDEQQSESYGDDLRGVGVGLTHTENLIIKKLRIARETGDLEAETGEEPKKPDIGRVVESYFNHQMSIQVT